jgi:hypothetical protein
MTSKEFVRAFVNGEGCILQQTDTVTTLSREGLTQRRKGAKNLGKNEIARLAVNVRWFPPQESLCALAPLRAIIDCYPITLLQSWKTIE